MAAALGSSAAAAPLPKLVEATQTGAQQTDVVSKITGRTYRIYIAKPLLPPPPTGYPVVYVLDGNGYFNTAAMQMVLGQFGELKPAIIVGIGYPISSPLEVVRLRTRDMTPPTKIEDLTESVRRGLGGSEQSYGGADAFRQFLVDELRPALAETYPIDGAAQSLVGHSFGGLFALHVLFNATDSFQTYVIGSPSIWWGRKSVLAGEADFKRRVLAGKAAPRVLITVGGLEQAVPDLPDAAIPPGSTRQDLARSVEEARMVDNARELAQRLKVLHGAKPYEVRYTVFADESHVSGIPAMISRAVGFALGR